MDAVGSGGRGRGKRKFAPQGSWRRHTGEEDGEGGDVGAEWFPIFQRPHAIPFPSPAPQETGKGQKKPQTLIEKGLEIWGSGDSTYNAEVINGIYQNITKSK